MVAESEFLRHVNERVRNWRQDEGTASGSGSSVGMGGSRGSGFGSGLGSGLGLGGSPRMLLDGDRLLLPSYGWVEKDRPDVRMQTPN
jgi:hypothetical protein